jgi:hypothetical protein
MIAFFSLMIFSCLEFPSAVEDGRETRFRWRPREGTVRRLTELIVQVLNSFFQFINLLSE